MKTYIGTFTEEQLKKGEDKIAIENAQKLSELKYIHNKITPKGMEIYLSNQY